MTQRLLSTGDVLEIASQYGLTAKEFRGWREKGHAVPAEGGEGHGDHAKWTIMQCVGICVAASERHSERGCHIEWVGPIIAAFSSVTERWLLKQINEDGAFLMDIHYGKPLLRGSMGYTPQRPNVQEIHAHVVEQVEQIEKRLQNQQYGRPRGLASVNR